MQLTGPCKVVNTACASSLDAILEAVQGIKAGAFDAAIAGGVNLLSSQEVSRGRRQSGFLAPGGRCRTFDAGADGYVRGEGCGLVLLTREDLCEGGHFYAEILGGASNHNAGRSASITAPAPVPPMSQRGRRQPETPAGSMKRPRACMPAKSAGK